LVAYQVVHIERETEEWAHEGVREVRESGSSFLPFFHHRPSCPRPSCTSSIIMLVDGSEQHELAVAISDGLKEAMSIYERMQRSGQIPPKTEEGRRKLRECAKVARAIELDIERMLRGPPSSSNVAGALGEQQEATVPDSQSRSAEREQQGATVPDSQSTSAERERTDPVPPVESQRRRSRSEAIDDNPAPSKRTRTSQPAPGTDSPAGGRAHSILNRLPHRPITDKELFNGIDVFEWGFADREEREDAALTRIMGMGPKEGGSLDRWVSLRHLKSNPTR
jgi:hypothetical protein